MKNSVYLVCLIPFDAKFTYDDCKMLGMFDTFEDANEFARKWILSRKEYFIQDEHSGIYVTIDEFEQPSEILLLSEVSLLPINVDVNVQSVQIF